MRGIILGAGITGLAAGMKTGFPIYEKSSVPGGLCRTYRKDGYRFEVGGGHWIFGDPQVIRAINNITEVRSYSKISGVYFNTILPAPIQRIHSVPTVGSMKDWMHERFGHTICGVFFDPFHERYTAGLYDKIIQDDPDKSPKHNKNRTYNDDFAYPIAGLDVLIDEMAKICSGIHYNKKAERIKMYEKKVVFSDGSEFEYDRLISTIPLRQLVLMTDPPMVTQEEDLPYTSVAVLNIGAKRGPKCPKEQWLYIPYGDTGYFRVGFYSNVDPDFAPEGMVSIYVERALPGGSFVEEEDYADRVIRDLQEWGWIGECEYSDLRHIEYAYTWINKMLPRDKYINFLKRHHIFPIGRYGKWKFQGIAESFLDGLEVMV